MVVENFSRSVIEKLLDVVDFAARDVLKVSPFGDELTNQPVGVFAGAPLPGAVGFGKEDGHFQAFGQQLVLSEFLAVVEGDATAAGGRNLEQESLDLVTHAASGAVLGFGQQHVTRLAIDEKPVDWQPRGVRRVEPWCLKRFDGSGTRWLEYRAKSTGVMTMTSTTRTWKGPALAET